MLGFPGKMSRYFLRCLLGVALVVAAGGHGRAEFRPLAIGKSPSMPQVAPGDGKPSKTPEQPAPEDQSRQAAPRAAPDPDPDDASGDGGGFRPLSVGNQPAQKQVRLPQSRTEQPTRRKKPPAQRRQTRQAPAQQPQQVMPQPMGLGIQPNTVGLPTTPLGVVEPTVSAPGNVLRSTTVLFESMSNKLTPEAEAELAALASTVSNNKGLVLEMTAYASDPDLPRNQARALSLRRALEIQRYMIKRQISKRRLIVRAEGYGDGSATGPAHRVDINVLGN